MSRMRDAPASKLSRRRDGKDEPASGVEKLMGRGSAIKRNKNFRMRPRDIERLEGLVERAGEVAGRKVAEAALLGGALLLAEKVPTEKLLEAIKDSEWQ